MLGGAALSKYRALFVALVALYGLTASGHVFSADGYKRLELTRAMLAGSPCISGGLPLGDGRFVPHWLPMHSLLGVPPVVVARFLHRAAPRLPLERLESAAFSSINQVVCAVDSCLLAALVAALGYRRRTALACGLAFGAASFVWPSAKDTFEAPIALMWMLAFLALLVPEGTDDEPARLPLAAAALALLLFTRITGVAMVPGLLAAGLIRPDGRWRAAAGRRLGWCLAGLAAALAMHLAYNAFRFGDPWEFGTAREAAVVAHTGAPGMLSTPLWVGLAGNTVSPARGLAWYSPLVALALFGWPGLVRRAGWIAPALLAAVIPEALLLCKWFCWDGGWCWGPRFQFNLHAILFLPLAELLETHAPRHAGWRRGLALAAALGVATQVLAVCACFHRGYFTRIAEGQDTYTLWWSPQLEQVRSLRYILSRDSPVPLLVHPPPDTPVPRLLEIDAKLNLFDFWWVYAPRAGVSRAAVMPLVGCLAVVLAGAAWLLGAQLREGSPA